MEKRDNLLVKGKSTQTVFRLLCQVSAEGEETEPELLTRGVAKMLTQREKNASRWELVSEVKAAKGDLEKYFIGFEFHQINLSFWGGYHD